MRVREMEQQVTRLQGENNVLSKALRRDQEKLFAVTEELDESKARLQRMVWSHAM